MAVPVIEHIGEAAAAQCLTVDKEVADARVAPDDVAFVVRHRLQEQSPALPPATRATSGGGFRECYRRRVTALQAACNQVTRRV